MRPNLPTPDEILEELADRVAVQIDGLAPVAFDAALREMTRYHRFLLNLSAARSPEGTPVSYAAVEGEALFPPRDEWITQYGRLFERAANRIGDDYEFAAKLAHVPVGLLPRRGDPPPSEDVVQSIVGMGSMLAHRLEAWVTKRTIVQNAPGNSAVPRVGLAGSDARAYANLLPHVVGAWETLLQVAPTLYHWRDDQKDDAPRRWDTVRASWPFLWKHLKTTAHMLAAAAWNEDEVGSHFYRDALVRWPETLRHEMADYADLPQRRFIFPDVLKLRWDETVSRIKVLLPQYMDAPEADELFKTVLQGAHDDILLLTAALLLHWSIEEKQVTDIGARRAAELLRRDVADREEWSGPTSQQRTFRALMLDILRLDMAGQRFEKSTYGAGLDHFVESLDRMTERRVVPGRIFTPSTLHGRDGLQIPLLTMLLAAVPTEGNDGTVQRIRDLAKNEAILPDGDGTLRDLLRGFSLFTKALEEHSSRLLRGVALLKPEAEFGRVRQSLQVIVAAAVASIEHERTERLRARPIDPKKLDELRDAAQAGLLSVPARVPFFRGFSIEKVEQLPGVESISIPMDGVPKAHLITPPMDSPALNFKEVYVRGITDVAGGRVWRIFQQRARTHVAVDARIEDFAYWQEMKRLALNVGAEPTLVISRQAEGRALRRLIHKPASEPSPLDIKRRSREETESGSYIATIEKIDVYGANFTPGIAWLFSSHLLQSVRYRVDADGHILRLSFVLGEDFKGSIRSEFAQDAAWADWMVYEISCRDPSDFEQS